MGRLGRLIRSDYGRWSAVFLFFSVAAVVQTWPLVLHATDRIADWPAKPIDSWQHLWNLWWVKHALVELRTNPFHTDFLFFPQGSDLYLHTLVPVNGVLSIPLQLITHNLILSWNVLALFSFVLSGLGMYALSYQVNRNHAGALISGYIFAFAPFTFMHFIAGHWNISTTWPIPFFVLFLVRFQRSAHMRGAIGAGILWALLTYNHLEYGVDAALFLGLFLLYWSVLYAREKDWARLRAFWRGGAVVVLVWLAASAPLVALTVRSLSQGDINMGYIIEEQFTSSPEAFLTPSPLWGPGTDPVGGGAQFHTGGLENTVYLGITPLLLALLAVFAVRRMPHRVIFWGAVFLFFAILSLGPHLFIGETKTFSIGGVSFSIPLPYQIYDQLPLIGERRVPARLIVFGIAGLSVLAGTGFDVLWSWLRQNYRMIAPLVALLPLALVVVEYWNPPLQLSDLSARPSILTDIRDEPGAFVVFDLPWGRSTGTAGVGDWFAGGLTDYYQTIHERPSFGGYVSRARNSDLDLAWVREEPGLRYLALPGSSPSPEDVDPRVVRSVFQRYRIKYVIMHRLTPHGWLLSGISEQTLMANDSYLRDVVGLTPVYTNPTLTIYRNPQIE
ncbi:MAG: hypothetical protein E3J81_00750 [Dehalococcoidia bacterium]|nr:MAG: hypothetical protein E3J81_00750 [Dehalococcoidia bacterium]